MRPQILFIQGGGSGAHKEDKRLVASLRKHLGSTSDVRYPQMPKESNPDYRRWRPQIRKELTSMKGNVIFAGHSLGGSFLLKYLFDEKIEMRVAGLFLIATPYWGGEAGDMRDMRQWRYRRTSRQGCRKEHQSSFITAEMTKLRHLHISRSTKINCPRRPSGSSMDGGIS